MQCALYRSFFNHFDWTAQLICEITKLHYFFPKTKSTVNRTIRCLEHHPTLRYFNARLNNFCQLYTPFILFTFVCLICAALNAGLSVIANIVALKPLPVGFNYTFFLKTKLQSKLSALRSKEAILINVFCHFTICFKKVWLNWKFWKGCLR